jgi:cell division transport system permease protein
MSPAKRALRAAKNDWRLHALSVFSVAVAFVCLASALLVVVNVDALKSRWETTGRASVYLKAGVQQKDVAGIEKALRATAGVTELSFLSSESARKQLVESSGDSLLAELPDAAFPASIEVELVDGAATERMRKVAAQLEELPLVEAVETYEAWGDRIGRLLQGGLAAAGVLALIVLAAVASVVSSTMRLALQRRKREVEVLKLVGATEAYVRRPFLLEGAAQGGLGAALALFLLLVLYLIVNSQFDQSLSAVLGIVPTFLPWSVALVLVALGGILGVGAAYVSLRRLTPT